MMKLYNNPQSRGLTLLPLLKELQIEDQIEQVEVSYEYMHQAEYLQINPIGKVPCLVDQEIVISEMAAIFIYLADKYSDKGLAPADRKSTRLNSSHVKISYAVFCLKKKKKEQET